MQNKNAHSELRRHERPIVVVADIVINDVAVSEILNGIEKEAETNGWQLRELGVANMDLPTPRPIGAIVGGSPMRFPVLDLLKEATIPIVRLNVPPPYTDPTVCSDKACAGALAGEHFNSLGFHDVGYIGQRNWSSGIPLYKGFSEFVKAHDMTLHLLQLTGLPLGKDGHNSTRDHNRLAVEVHRAQQITAWLRTLPKPIGVLAYHDQFASRLCSIVQSAGFSVPEDVAILGLNNTVRVCELAPVPISSIEQDFFETGRQAMRLLSSMLAGNPPPADPVMIRPTTIVERRSTNILAVKDPRAARALRFLWDNLDVQLTVDDVAHEIGVSHSTLDRMFRKHLGRGVNAELQRKRLERCRKLLRATTMTFEEITRAVGYSSAPSLYRTFKKKVGVTPNAYRSSPHSTNHVSEANGGS